ncbi:DEAD/DEAH box helicase [Robertkochia sediminum]|uniref:DEAD/DEAH box helicase n=1 Tax=Robertkochia sediminum TaxID=2785326 RepID=UPI001931A99A|nr:DEAD/DEAH box helicase [Robertkochia sediminum]MBL7472063.1 DEAD/DEAH box helicase [Robertkochia sediminum]
MSSFQEFNLSPRLQQPLSELGITQPTPIQEKSFSVIKSGSDMLGIAQTGTGKTLAYLLPVLDQLKFSKDPHPRVLIVVPTRELVVQVADTAETLCRDLNLSVLGVYGGTNINRQKDMLSFGCDILVATPGRLYDLVISRAVQLRNINKFILDEVDIMLDLGFRFQLTNIFDLLPERRQNIMFSATMTEDIEAFILNFFTNVTKVSVGLSGTPLENITQTAYAVPNFYTKVNLLRDLLADEEVFRKVLVFVSNKKSADLLASTLQDTFGESLGVIHSNKTQNYRLRSLEQFEKGEQRILVTTDVSSRGLDLEKISHVINFDTPFYPENYIHRIGRTGRAKEKGTSILLFTEKEQPLKEAIEELMDLKIPEITLPEDIEIATQLSPDERPQKKEAYNPLTYSDSDAPGPAFHEKKEKNKKTNQGGSYRRTIKQKYKKPKTRGDKRSNNRKKKK